MNTPVIEVRIWGRRIGAVAPDPRLGCHVYAYDPAWRRNGIQLAPLTMPLDDPRTSFAFPELSEPTYKRLPGLLADALPDDFGNALIDAWMAAKGVEKCAITTLDRLAYMGKRGMGALEFKPARGAHRESAEPLGMKNLVEAARQVVHGDISGDVQAQAALASIIVLARPPVARVPRPSLPGTRRPIRSAVASSTLRPASSTGCSSSTASARTPNWVAAPTTGASNTPTT